LRKHGTRFEEGSTTECKVVDKTRLKLPPQGAQSVEKSPPFSKLTEWRDSEKKGTDTGHLPLTAPNPHGVTAKKTPSRLRKTNPSVIEILLPGRSAKRQQVFGVKKMKSGARPFKRVRGVRGCFSQLKALGGQNGPLRKKQCSKFFPNGTEEKDGRRKRGARLERGENGAPARRRHGRTLLLRQGRAREKSPFLGPRPHERGRSATLVTPLRKLGISEKPSP